MTEKRVLPDSDPEEVPAKKVCSGLELSVRESQPGRSLAAPTLQLSGHNEEVTSVRFSPDGQCLASASLDKTIFCWRAFGENENYLVIKGHTNAVLDVHWFAAGDALVSCSADKTVRCWDAETGLQVKKLSEHTGTVNSCCPQRRGLGLFTTGADDSTTKVWDLRVKRSVHTIRGSFPVCAVAFADDGHSVYSGGVDNSIKVWDLRKVEEATPSIVLKGHSDTVTGLSLSPDGSHLLSNSMDNTLREWDVRPYAPANRCTKVFTGHLHNFEKNLLRCEYSPDGSKVTCGSADRMVNIWGAADRNLTYKLPGHTGSVNAVVFHPTEPVIASASSDKTVMLGELLQ